MTPRRILLSVAAYWEQSFAEVQGWAWTFFCGAYVDMIDRKRRETLRERRQKRVRREKQTLRELQEEGRKLLDSDGF